VEQQLANLSNGPPMQRAHRSHRSRNTAAGRAQQPASSNAGSPRTTTRGPEQRRGPPMGRASRATGASNSPRVAQRRVAASNSLRTRATPARRCRALPEPPLAQHRARPRARATGRGPEQRPGPRRTTLGRRGQQLADPSNTGPPLPRAPQSTARATPQPARATGRASSNAGSPRTTARGPEHAAARRCRALPGTPLAQHRDRREQQLADEQRRGPPMPRAPGTPLAQHNGRHEQQTVPTNSSRTRATPRPARATAGATRGASNSSRTRATLVADAARSPSTGRFSAGQKLTHLL